MESAAQTVEKQFRYRNIRELYTSTQRNIKQVIHKKPGFSTEAANLSTVDVENPACKQ